MAFPSVTVTESSNGANTTTPTITLPASVAAGDLLIAAMAGDGARDASWPAGWNELADDDISTVAHFSMAYRIATGGETSVQPTVTPTERSNHIALRITGWHGTTPPEISTVATGASASPNPTGVTASWGSADNLFIAIYGMDSGTLTGYPTNYSDNQTDNATATSAAIIALATRNLASATDDPGNFTVGVSDNWTAYTIVVRPAASGTLYTPATMNGGLTFSGSLVKRDNKALTGGLTFSGAFSKRANKALTGGLTFAGAFAKRTAKAFTGGLTFSGALSASRVILQALTGGLSFSGSLSNRTNKSLTGGLTFSGSLVRRTSRAFSGQLLTAGSLVKRTARPLTGALSFSGSLSLSTRKVLAGGLSFTGSLTKQTWKGLSGALSFVGDLAREYIPFVAGTTYYKELTASLSFVGSLTGAKVRLFAGSALDRAEWITNRFPHRGLRPVRGVHRRRRL
jgi:hypothetical protein